MGGLRDGTVPGPMFRYSDELMERYPTVQAGVIHAGGLTNGASPGGLVDDFLAEQRAATRRLEQTPIAELPSISAWRRAFSDFGAKPTQYRNAAEALLRRLDKQGNVPLVNILVDVGNLVAVRRALPVAIFDLARVEPPITVCFASGDERFTDLGSGESLPPEPGEVIFVDRQGAVAARRWCWRQSMESATGPSTVEALFVVEALHAEAGPDVDAAVSDVTELLRMYQPDSRVRSWRLSAADRTTRTA